MSQNKYMHPRNIYKNPPNFKLLAISYPEFRKFTKQVIGTKHKYVDNLLKRFLCVSAMQCGDSACPALSLKFISLLETNYLIYTIP